MHHPDKVGNTQKSNEISAKMNAAFATLFDEEKQQKHDTDIPVSKKRMSKKTSEMDSSDSNDHSNKGLHNSFGSSCDDDDTEASDPA